MCISASLRTCAPRCVRIALLSETLSLFVVVVVLALFAVMGWAGLFGQLLLLLLLPPTPPCCVRAPADDTATASCVLHPGRRDGTGDWGGQWALAASF